jgi:hypothetical protein
MTVGVVVGALDGALGVGDAPPAEAARARASA